MLLKSQRAFVNLFGKQSFRVTSNSNGEFKLPIKYLDKTFRFNMVQAGNIIPGCTSIGLQKFHKGGTVIIEGVDCGGVPGCN